METLGARLRRLRNEKNLSVKDVADSLGIPTTTYREWENGRKIVGEPYVGLSKLLEVSVYELITGEKIAASEFLTSIDLIEEELRKVKKYLLSAE